MDFPLIAARAVHFAAQLSLAGIFGFVALVATPAYDRAGATVPAALRRRFSILGWTSLVLALLSGVFWLLVVAHSMSARPYADLWPRGITTAVVTTTQYGHAWILRMSLLVLLIPGVALLGKRRAFDALAALLAAALLAATAWQGHAGAEEGLQGVIHLFADGAHLIAAGGWVGTLVPLALLLAEARRAGDRQAATIARAATIAFSDIGLSCVAALLVTGAVNAWLLVGSVPALIGTFYGQLLLAKITLFAIMIALATFNRLRLLPRLATTDHGRKAKESRAALALIQRNALIEAVIGLAVIGIVAILGVQVPGAHQEPWWPFSFRFGLDAVQAVPEFRSDAIGTAIAALIGLVLLAFGLRRRRALPIGLGLLLFVGLGWRPVELLMIPATPTSYYASPNPFSVASILAGRETYARNCVFCHGADGQGDGPLAAELPIAPADLTAHLFMHTDGDLFWFISNGMDNGVMPAFSATLSATQRWDLINLLKARAASVVAATLSADVTADPAPLAPDFPFPAQAGAPGTLSALLAQDAVLLVMTDEPQPPFVERLQDWRSVLAENGVTILVLSNDRDVRSVYALYDRSLSAGAVSDPRPVEFLVDRNGYIRARWRPGDTPDWQDLDTLTREIAAMNRLRLAPVAPLSHVHPSN